MSLAKIFKLIDEVDAKLTESASEEDKEKEVLLRTVKLSEEMGELSEAVLSAYDRQRSTKLKKYTTNHLLEEFADVIITTLLVAKSIGVNKELDSAIERKIKKIDRRFSNL